MRNLLALLLMFTCTSAFSQSNSLSDSIAVENYIDGTIQTLMRNKNIPGATFSMVKDGKIVFLKGYGYADLEEKIKVDPNKSLFRIGSISKMFVWLSIMQLYEQGKLSLDDDVNLYFDEFKIEDTFPEPVTIKNLLTHAPGFEDRIIGLFGKDSASMQPLSEILVQQMPERVRPPGTFASYSNHGTGMAQLIVEKVSGLDFNDYVEQNILRKLGMSHTTFQQPLPDNLKPDAATGYLYENDDFVPQDFEYVPMSGVGGCSTTAVDMAKFMLANLQLGSLDSTHTILDTATMQLMQSPAFSHHENVNPMRYGYMDVSQNGKTIIGHGGDTFWFHSIMALYPEENLGIFLSFNGQNGGEAYFDFLEAFTDKYFPEQISDIKPALSKEDLEAYAGAYSSNRYPHSTIAKISKLAGVQEVSVTDEGYLKFTTGGKTSKWIPEDEFTFRNTMSSDVIVFQKNEQGKITHLMVGLLPIFAFEKTDGLDQPDLHSSIFFILIIFILITLIFWPIVYFVNRKYGNRASSVRSLPAQAKLVGWTICFLWILMFILMGIGFSNPFDLVFNIPVTVKIALIIPFIIIPLMLYMLIQVFYIWKSGQGTVFGRIFYTFLFLILIDGIWLLSYWNFIGFKY